MDEMESEREQKIRLHDTTMFCKRTIDADADQKNEHKKHAGVEASLVCLESGK